MNIKYESIEHLAVDILDIAKRYGDSQTGVDAVTKLLQAHSVAPAPVAEAVAVVETVEPVKATKRRVTKKGPVMERPTIEIDHTRIGGDYEDENSVFDDIFAWAKDRNITIHEASFTPDGYTPPRIEMTEDQRFEFKMFFSA